MTQPRISVLMPVYNALPYLDAAVASILAQTEAGFELIAIDDGSTDGSGARLEQLAADDARIRLVRRENRGIVATLNEAIALAGGTYLARMDADDIALPERFAQQLARFEAEPDLVALGGQYLLVDPVDRPIRTLPMPLSHEEIEAWHLQTPHPTAICHPTAMLRRAAVERAGGYREGFAAAEDIDLWLRLGEIGRLANLPDRVLQYRMHAGSIGHRRRTEQMQSCWRAADEAAGRRGLPRPAPPAPGQGKTDHSTPAIMYRRWAWWALGDGNHGTARHYAGRALRHDPFSTESWRLAAIALRDSVARRGPG